MNTLLDFSTIEAGRMRAAFEPTDLASLTTDLASSFRSAFERAGLTFDVRCDAIPEAIAVDRAMWEKIVLNLLSNALKFTFQGGVEVRLSDLGDSVSLSVRDTGVGIAAADVSRIFDRFHRVEGARARTHEGSGIGLALVNDLVRLHGGVCEVTSVPGEGTTLTVTIPKAHDGREPGRIATRQQPAFSPRANAYVSEALRWLPDAAGRRRPTQDGRRSSRSRRTHRPGTSCWPTTTPTCATTSRACCSVDGRSKRSPTAPPRSRRSGHGGSICW